MQRVAFQLRVKACEIARYDEAHRAVWPEMLDELTRLGVREYSIFRRGQDLFLTMRVPDFARLLEHLAASDVNRRWQQAMAPLFEPVPGILPGEKFAMMQEVFYLRGSED
jgi:L-rhamnose mutarotase